MWFKLAIKELKEALNLKFNPYFEQSPTWGSNPREDVIGTSVSGHLFVDDYEPIEIKTDTLSGFYPDSDDFGMIGYNQKLDRIQSPYPNTTTGLSDEDYEKYLLALMHEFFHSIEQKELRLDVYNNFRFAFLVKDFDKIKEIVSEFGVSNFANLFLEVLEDELKSWEMVSESIPGIFSKHQRFVREVFQSHLKSTIEIGKLLRERGARKIGERMVEQAEEIGQRFFKIRIKKQENISEEHRAVIDMIDDFNYQNSLIRKKFFPRN